MSKVYADYLKSCETYKKVLALVTNDLCDEEMGFANKKLLASIGIQVKKHVEYLQEVLAGTPQD